MSDLKKVVVVGGGPAGKKMKKEVKISDQRSAIIIYLYND